MGIVIQLPDIERNRVTAAAHDFDTFVVHLEILDSKVGLGVSCLLILGCDNTKLHSITQYLLWCKRSSCNSYRQPVLIRDFRISKSIDWY